MGRCSVDCTAHAGIVCSDIFLHALNIVIQAGDLLTYTATFHHVCPKAAPDETDYRRLDDN